MTLRFALPDVGEGLHEAEIVRWLVAAGDTVARDQPLVEILTDKAQVELPSPAAGVIRTIDVAEGAVVAVGTVLVEIDDGRTGPAGAPVPAAPVSAGPLVPATAGPASQRIDVESAEAGAPNPSPHIDVDSPGGRPKASPSTRKLAARLGVELAQVRGSGPGGRILAADVEAHHAAPAAPLAAPATPTPSPAFSPAAAAPTPTAPAAPIAGPLGAVPRSWRTGTDGLGQHPVGTHPLRGIRRLTAQAMTQSWTTIPHITGLDEVDASALLDTRRRLRESLQADGATAEAAALTPLVLLAASVARALRRFPLVNAAVGADGASVTVYEQVNLGIAVATADGLIVPVVTDADRRDLVSLALEMQRLAQAARDRTVKADELRGGTFTLTNYGALGGRLATPLILPGQAGIMGFGAIKERPIVLDGAVVARRTLPVAFSADHRIIDGDLSVAFQETVVGFVAEPLKLLLGA